MRRTLFAGALLVVGTALTVLVGEALDLEVEAVALLGVASGAIVGLVPDESASRRLAAFALGLLAAYVGYVARAAVTPDTSAGRAVAAGFIVLLCLGVYAISGGRLPFWAALLGSASLAGAYEHVYTQAATRVLDTSVSSLTSLAVCAAVGFVLAVALQPKSDEAAAAQRRHNPTSSDHESSSTPLDDMMETSK